MAKAKIAYVCTECGAHSVKWAGQCAECSAWIPGPSTWAGYGGSHDAFLALQRFNSEIPDIRSIRWARPGMSNNPASCVY